MDEAVLAPAINDGVDRCAVVFAEASHRRTLNGNDPGLDGAASWTQEGHAGLAVDLVGYRLYDACSDRIYAATDGAPANLLDATRCGFASRAEYARARQAEFEKALALTGHQPSEVKRQADERVATPVSGR